ncbi:4-hydroxy-tetrahydrodipicolinate synthase [Microbacterium sp. W4I4]|uniref:dihydrodipicolinate synthase family protein n=1 Tax=Microbacterium sp. W4I4 TaxID=3042295 RepID=UPI00278562E4|nr:dihydrodipicolinate synthase family protein [Microbacterium sp. W4I4]MDQ0613919.1 4-hydroxy-tetrahydrodipicolinate synthase [Microbacterium sp. W4I4]
MSAVTQEARAALESGVWGVVATPFTADASAVDELSLARLVQFSESAGVRGLTVLGVFGEAASLTEQERELALRVVVDSTDVPIVTGITALDTDDVIREIASAAAVTGERFRAAMVQVNSSHADDVVRHLEAIVAATGASIVLQDYPRASGVAISADALQVVLDAGPGIVAVKAEAPPTSPAVARITACGTTASVFGGLGGQGLLDELVSGAAGAMTGFSFPEGLVRTIDAWQEGGFSAASRALLPYLPLINFEQQAGIALGIRKELMRRRGLIENATVRPPATPFPAALSAHAQRHLDLVAELQEA